MAGSVDDKIDQLRGNNFMGRKEYYPLEDETWERKCGLCLYREGRTNPDRDCRIICSPTPHELFGYKGQRLPEQIDGEEVGNYCPKFAPFVQE